MKTYLQKSNGVISLRLMHLFQNILNYSLRNPTDSKLLNNLLQAIGYYAAKNDNHKVLFFKLFNNILDAMCFWLETFYSYAIMYKFTF